MDRSLMDGVRLSDIPNNLNDLIETWLCRFGSSANCVQLYFYENVGGHPAFCGAANQRVAIYTDNNQYMIHAKWGAEGHNYLGCIARARKPRAGEDHHRGSDLADGPFTYGTWFRILADIISYEMVHLAKSARPVPDGYQFPSSSASPQNAVAASSEPELNPA